MKARVKGAILVLLSIFALMYGDGPTGLSQAFIGAALGLASGLGGMFGGKEQKRYLKEKRAMSKNVRTKYLPQFTSRMYGAADEWKKDLEPFYDQYLAEGSPLLRERQRMMAERIGEEGGRASRTAASRIAQSGYGFTPSGLAAGVQGGIAQSTARSAADAYLTNLLENEMFKFQAAQGKADMFKTNMQAFNPSALAGFLNDGGAGAIAANVDQGFTEGLSKIFGVAQDFFKKGGAGGTESNLPSSGTGGAFSPSNIFGPQTTQRTPSGAVSRLPSWSHQSIFGRP